MEGEKKSKLLEFNPKYSTGKYFKKLKGLFKPDKKAQLIPLDKDMEEYWKSLMD